MLRVNHAHYLDHYKIYVIFNDNKEGTINLENVLFQDERPIFKELIDLEKFKHFSVKADTIVWENGLDLAPEFLYEKLEK
jgi:hypothetical protein